MQLPDLHIPPSVLCHYIPSENGKPGTVSRKMAHLLMLPTASESQKRRVRVGLRELRDAIDEYLEDFNQGGETPARKSLNKMNEIEIEIRPDSISIGGAGIGSDPEAAREILQSALDALDSDREKEVFGNEIVVKK